MTATTNRDARALTTEALAQLQNALADAAGGADFLGRADAIVNRPSNHLQLRDDHGTPDPLDGTRSRAIDVENGPLVHQYLGEMDRANASDPRLWTYLALVTYRPYMEDRWSLSGSSWRSRAENRWLMPRVNRAALVRHGIARLWWLTHLTYEPHPAEPGDEYARTRVTFSNEDRVLAVFDREVGAIPSVGRGVLDHVTSDPANESSEYIRHLMKGLTLAHGYRDIGLLDDDALGELIRLSGPGSTS